MGLPEEWHGENPFYLLMVLESGTIVLDLDERGWKDTLKDELERPGEWHLCRKDTGQVALSMVIHPGDQPYYVARHIGAAGAGGQAETIAYGIGKKAKRMAGKGTNKHWAWNQDNMWVLAWGQVCGGTDVEYFAVKGLTAGRR